MTSRKTYQVEVLPHPKGAVIFHRLDNGSVFYAVIDFESRDATRHAPPPIEWVEVPPPPGVRPFTGANDGPDLDSNWQPPKRRRY